MRSMGRAAAWSHRVCVVGAMAAPARAAGGGPRVTVIGDSTLLGMRVDGAACIGRTTT